MKHGFLVKGVSLVGALAAAALCVACGGNVATEPTSSGAGGAGGSGGAGGTSGEAGGVTSSTTSTASAPVCPPGDYFVTVAHEGVLTKYTAGCPGSETGLPTGLLSGGGECADGLLVRACASADADTPYLFVSSALQGAGSAVQAQLDHVDEQGAQWSGDTGLMNVTSFGEVGQIIEGEYGVEVTALVEGQPTSAVIEGTFRVCRAPDQPPCP